MNRIVLLALAAALIAPSAARAQDTRVQRIDALEARLRTLEARAAAAPTPATAAPAPAASTAPFGFADFTWVSGSGAPHQSPLTFGPFAAELRVDTSYHYSFANPIDDTISGSSEVFRANELQITQLGFGGMFDYGHVHARVMTQFGMYSQATPRNDASAARGQWNLDDAYRYFSEAYGGVHIDELNGINIEAGIFSSYVGLWSNYNSDNWTYQPSYVSSNTPWFFTGMRAQIFVGNTLKIEPWLINGWQSYGKFNEAPGVGGQVLWRPTDWLSIVSNNYGGADTLGRPGRVRFHNDDSVVVKYYDQPDAVLDRMAASLTVDVGCESGGSQGVGHEVRCDNQYFLGFMLYDRVWFDHNHVGFTVGGGAMTNPGRYLVLMPPINGATAYTGSPYFTENPGDPYQAWDMQLSADWSPFEFVTFRLEFNHRAASVPYFSGHGGVTPRDASGAPVNQGPAGSAVPGWTPDLAYSEDRLTLALMVRM